MKKLLCLVTVFALCFCSLFAEKTYSIKIDNANSMDTSDSLVILEGDVKLSFTTTDEEDSQTRTLLCDRVVINLDEKILQAFGNVVLDNSNASTFRGSEISLNWESLDVVVFGGKGFSERSNSSGQNVEFMSFGERISYSGDVNTVYFEDGTVSTKEKDPNWSIAAEEIGIFDSDMFFRKAWLKLGRVPVLYLPFFFYPGTTLSFNPSVGLSSSRGSFLNTTYEVYGSYSNVNSSDSSAGVLSFFDSNDNSKKMRDGLYYTDFDYSKLSDTQKWAYDNASYLAVFADVYEKLGAGVGFDTYNKLNENTVLSAVGIVAKPSIYSSYSKLRYGFDLNARVKSGNTNLKLNLPYLSDPYVKQDFLNRNTTFSFDSLFGSFQEFPSYYSSIYEYKWTLESDTSFKIGKTNVQIRDLDANLNFNYSHADKKFNLLNAVLPSGSVSLSGTLVDWKTDSEQVVVREAQPRESKAARIGDIKAFEVPQIGSQTKTLDGAKFNVSYALNGNIKDLYTKDFEKSSGTYSADGKVTVNAALERSLVTMTEVVSGVYTKDIKTKDIKNMYSQTSENGKITSDLKLEVPSLGIKYNFANNLVSYKADNDGYTFTKGLFRTEDVSAHSVSVSAKQGAFSLELSSKLKPLTQSITPSLSYSKNGVTAKTGITVYPEREVMTQGSVGSLDLGLSRSSFNFSMANKYDFAKEGLDGYSFTQNLNINPKKNWSFTEKLVMGEGLKVDTLQLFLGSSDNNITMSFAGEKISPDNLKIVLAYVREPMYFLDNRVGFEGKASGSFTWDFENPYASSLALDLSFNFGIFKLLDVGFSATVANTSFYKYFDDSGNFVLSSLVDDLKRSVDFSGGGRYNTGFNISSMNLKIVHYMEDWNLYFNAGAGIGKREDGIYTLKPEASVIIKWNMIPELKVKNDF